MLEAGEGDGQAGQERLPSGQASGGDIDEVDDNQDNDDPDER